MQGIQAIERNSKLQAQMIADLLDFAGITYGKTGLGLGLAIVKHLMELHNGTIESFSEGEGRGATFTITLPLSDKETASRPTETQRMRSMDLTGVVALVVEDDVDARELTKRILTDAGAVVVDVNRRPTLPTWSELHAG